MSLETSNSGLAQWLERLALERNVWSLSPTHAQPQL